MPAIVIVQARLGSSRLPGKILERIGPRAMLWHVVENAAAAAVGPVFALFPREDEPHERKILAALAGARRVALVFAGLHQDDALGRFAELVETMPTDTLVVRVTADCPFLDPLAIRAAVDVADALGPYLDGVVTNSWPSPASVDGLDVEVMTARMLVEADERATEPEDREHVTPWLRRQRTVLVPDTELLDVLPAVGERRHKWSVDDADDLAWARRVYEAAADEGWRSPAPERIAEVLRKQPELVRTVPL